MEPTWECKSLLQPLGVAVQQHVAPVRQSLLNLCSGSTSEVEQNLVYCPRIQWKIELLGCQANQQEFCTVLKRKKETLQFHVLHIKIMLNFHGL